MRLGIFADIHANREAFAGCLAHANIQGIDQYLFLGDFLGYGADPEWVLEIIMRSWENGALVVLGNHDAAILWERDEYIMHEDARTAIAWTRARLNNDHLAFLKSVPLVIETSEFCSTHANPWAPNTWEYITDTLSAAQAMDATRCPYIFAGHVHHSILYHRSITGKMKYFIPHPGVPIPLNRRRNWVALIGSVGQPRDGIPAACYAIYDSHQDTLTYYRIPFDVEASAAKIRVVGLPDWNAERLILGV